MKNLKQNAKNEEKLSGVEVEDSELDTAMEKIREKWQGAEAQDVACNNANKKKIKADRASGEEVRKKAAKSW